MLLAWQLFSATKVAGLPNTCQVGQAAFDHDPSPVNCWHLLRIVAAIVLRCSHGTVVSLHGDASECHAAFDFFIQPYPWAAEAVAQPVVFARTVLYLYFKYI